MRKRGYAFFIVVLTSAPAWSQQTNRGLTSGSPKFPNYLYPMDVSQNASSDDTRCLVRKATGRTECRTMSDWRQIASKINKSISRKP